MFVEVALTTACQDIESTGFLTRNWTVYSGPGCVCAGEETGPSLMHLLKKNAVVCNLMITLHRRIIFPPIWVPHGMPKQEPSETRCGFFGAHSTFIGSRSVCGPATGGRHDDHESVRDAAQRKCQLCTHYFLYITSLGSLTCNMPFKGVLHTVIYVHCL